MKYKRKNWRFYKKICSGDPGSCSVPFVRKVPYACLREAQDIVEDLFSER